ncbi:acetylornithine deacetylase [Rubricella aquisinus]|uniref:Acetylornithine deacetylase n=1 Tax=Rubricella aquisinus TaxID=2028108 RepID=A0A840WXY0_9RHOB|nr:acetylornithine deacetylase [Rubricella aquisinus]MBB5514525.1 acetylornithine deacetylase [Rubricella aquisinus]
MPTAYTPKEMLEKLVSFPTVSDQTNLPLIEFVESYLADHGITATRVPHPTEDKANLYAHIGPDVAGGTILSGHSDVVPVEGQAWDTDPWTLVERDGRLYGRGSCDMKGFVATALALVPDMLKAGLKRPIQIAISYDEEVGCTGAPPMIDHMREQLPPAAACIVGEPTMMKVVTGHKGCLAVNTTVHGYEVHSSMVDQGVPAVMVAAKLICWLDARMAENRAAPFDARNEGFIPPYTTLHAGTIAGGTAHNITAKHCEFMTDIRTVPSERLSDWLMRYQAEVARMEAEIQAIRPEARIDVDIVAMVEGCAPEENGAAEPLARRLTGDNTDTRVAYGTEAGQFQERGFSTVVCGPGDIAQAHQPNEFIEISQLDAGETFIRRLIADHAAA